MFASPPPNTIQIAALVSDKPKFWPIAIAGILIVIILFFLLKPFMRGAFNVLSFYKRGPVKSKLINAIFNAVISAVLTFIIFFTPIAFGGEPVWAMTVLELSALLLFFVFLLKAIRYNTVKYRKTILNGLFVVFISYLIFQILFTSKLPHRTFQGLKQVFLYFALFTVIVNHVRGREGIDNIIFKISLAGFFIASIGTLQALTGSKKMYWMVMPRVPTFFGPFSYWNHFAAYISLIALLTLGYICVKIFEAREVSWDRPLNVVLQDIFENTLGAKVFFMLTLFSIMVTAILLSKSRAGILLFLVTFIFFVSSLSSRGYFKKIVIPLFAGLATIALFLGGLSLGFAFMGITAYAGLGQVLSELYTILDPGGYIFRASMYFITFSNFLKECPFFGIGFWSVSDILPLYLPTITVYGWGQTPGLLHIAAIPRHIYSDGLEALIEMGFIGLTAILIPFFIFLRKLVKIIGGAQSGYKYIIGTAILSSLLFWALHGFIDYDMVLPAISSLYVIMLSLSVLVINLDPQKNLKINMETKAMVVLKTKINKNLSYLLSIVIFAFLAFIISKPLIIGRLTNSRATSSSFERAIALDAKNDKTYYNYYNFIMHQYKKDYLSKKEALDKANSVIDKAIKLNPYVTTYLIAKAELGLLKKDYREAAALYEKASLQEPNNPIIQMGYAIVLFWQGIHESYIPEKKDRLLKKGLIFYQKARTLSENQLSLRAMIKNRNISSLLIKNLKEEGIDIR